VKEEGDEEEVTTTYSAAIFNLPTNSNSTIPYG
jgi:hypothetical protein